MKRDLERAGTPATAMFWLATEDHDFDEVAQLCVPARSGQLDLVCVRGPRPAKPKVAVGPLPVPQALISELLSLVPMQRPAWLREGITFGDSFAELVASIFGNDIVLVDALLPELRRAGKPLFDSIIAKWDAIENAITTRSRELTDAGYEPQVTPRSESYSLLFTLDEHFERHLVDVPRAGGEPERISTSALTRPLLQDSVLQPDVFVGGPAEVSYYAQIAPLYQLLGIAMPRVALRGHALVAPKRMVRFFDRYGIDAARIFASPDDLLAEREPEGVALVRHQADEARNELMKQIERIGELALPADHALARRINRSIGHIEYHFDKLTERAIQGLVRKDRERYAAAKELVATLYPDGHVQDRIVAWFSYWHEYGQQLVDALVDAIEPDAPVFDIVPL
jgi:bacillithiol synthase